MNKEMVYGTVAVFLVLTNAVLVLSGPRAQPAPETTQEAPLAHSASLPSGNFVIVDGDQVTVCYTSTANSVTEFCEHTMLISHEESMDGH